MKKVVAAGAAAAIVIGAVAGPSLAATKTVSVQDNKFVPPTLTVPAGTTVTWVWKGKSPHNVTVTRGPMRFHSKLQTKGTFSQRLTKKGTYSILCTIHAPNMKQTITVR